jgi:hypothetical protein
MAFTKRHYDSYTVMLDDEHHVEATHEECFAPSYDKNQRWVWDDEFYSFATRLAPTEKGKQIGNAFLADLKRRGRLNAEMYACVGKDNCQHGGDCRACPFYESRTTSLDWGWDAEDEEGGQALPFEAVSNFGDPYKEAARKLKNEALADFLATLTEAERTLWDCDLEDMPDKDIAPLIGKKYRKDVYNARKKLHAKALAYKKLAGWHK